MNSSRNFGVQPYPKVDTRTPWKRCSRAERWPVGWGVTRLYRKNQAVAIEDLHGKEMLGNARLARSIAGVGFYEIRRQLQYEVLRYGTVIVLADRARTCSCGVRHDRDINAAISLQRLATSALAARDALPVASPAATPGTVAGMVPAAGGEVTPVRYEHGQQDGSGQEENAAHFRARS